MLASIVTRNVLRNRRRLLPLVVALIVTFLILVVGNAVLLSSDRALSSTYIDHIAGDLSVSATSDASFTLFGSEALLVGEYQVPPTLLGFDELLERVESMPEVRAVSPVVTGAASIEIGSRRRNRTIIGVDFDRFRETFPQLELVEGEFPASGERGVLVQQDYAHTVPRIVGRNASFVAAHDLSFTLRQAPVRAVFAYPVDDDLLRNIILVDAETARALNGYVYGAGGQVDLPEAEQQAFERDFDDLFGEADTFDEAESFDDADADDIGDTDEATTLDELEAFFRETADESAAERATAEGAWNFLLISLHDSSDAETVSRRLRDGGFTREAGFLVRDWRDTVGGNAQIAWYLQLMFNVGVLFVIAGAIMITTNALVLSVLERTAEIGAMRALGATRSRVSAMIAAETVIVVVGSAIVGIALGVLAAAGLNGAGLIVDNPYIDILFGGRPINALITARLLALHAGAALALAVLAVVYPLKRAIAIQPVEAMAE